MTGSEMSPENAPETPPDEKPTTTNVLLDLVKHRLLTIVGLLLLFGGVTLYFDLIPSVPRWLKLALIVGVLVSPSGYFAASYVLNLLPDPQMVFVVDVDAREPDGAIFQFPVRDFAELEILDGELHQAAPTLYFAREVDKDAMTALGNWKGTLSDRELLTAVSKIDECRGMLEDDAKRGFQIETQAWSIIRGATRSAVRSVVETFERGSLPDEGKGLGQEIDAALEQFDLDKEIRHVDNEGASGSENSSPDDLGDDPLADPDESQPEASADD